MGFLVALALLQTDLVRDLGHDDVQVRDRAARRLRLIGEEALPDLKAVDRHPDVELRARARALIRQIGAESCFDPRVINGHPELAAALRDGDRHAVIALARRETAADFERYALTMLDETDTTSWKIGLSFLTRSEAHIPIAPLVRIIEIWDPEGSEDRDRHWLKQIVEIALAKASAVDRTVLAEAHACHGEGAQAIAILQTSVGLPQGTETCIRLQTRGWPWMRRPALAALQKGRSVEERSAAPLPDVPTPRYMPIDDPPETLSRVFAEWEASREQRKARYRHPWCATGSTIEAGGGDILHALAATGDRSLSSLVVDRLGSPEWDIQAEAIRICGAWKIQDAAPILRRLARVGRLDTQALALKSLSLLESK